MPLIKLPTGDFFRVPEGLSDAEALSRAKARFPFMYDERGIGSRASAALGEGVKGLGESVEGVGLGLQSMLGDTKGTQKGIEEIRAREEKDRSSDAPRGLSVEQLKDIYNTQGLGALLKKVPSYVAEQVAQSAPSTAVPLAVGAGAAALSGPLAPIVGPLAGMATYGLQTFGSNIQRQAGTEGRTAETMEPGTAAVSAAATAPVGYLIDRFALGMNAFGPKKSAEIVLKEIAARGVGKTVATGATKGLAEVPTEVLEQVAERHQAGLPLWNAEAKKEYVETAGGALAFGTVGGGAGGIHTRSQARDQLTELQQAKDKQEQAQRALAAPEEERKQLFESTPASPEAPVQGDLFDGPTSTLAQPTQEAPPSIQDEYRKLKLGLDDVETRLSAARDAKNIDAYVALQPQYAQLQEAEKQLLAQAKEQGVADEVELSPEQLVKKLQKKIEVKMDKGEALGELPQRLAAAQARVASKSLDGTLFDPATFRAQDDKQVQEMESLADRGEAPDLFAQSKEADVLAQQEDLFQENKVAEQKRRVNENVSEMNALSEKGLSPDLRVGSKDERLLEQQNALYPPPAEPPATPRDEALVDKLVQEIGNRGGPSIVQVDPDLPKAQVVRMAEGYGKRADKVLFDLTDTLDSLRKGEFFGGTNPKAASTRIDTAKAKAEQLLSRLSNHVLAEAAHRRAAQGLAPLSQDEAIKGLFAIQQPLKRLIDMAVAPREKSTAMKEAGKEAGLKTKEGVLKRGLSREEFAKLTKDVQQVRNELASPKRTFQVAPFELTPGTPTMLAAQEKEGVGAEGKPLSQELLLRREALADRIDNALATRKPAGPVKNALNAALRVVGQNRGSRDFIGAVDRVLTQVENDQNITLKEFSKQMQLEGQAREDLIGSGQQTLFEGAAQSEGRKQKRLLEEIAQRKAKKKSTSGRRKELEKSNLAEREVIAAAKEAGVPGLGFETAVTRTTPTRFQKFLEKMKTPQVLRTLVGFAKRDRDISAGLLASVEKQQRAKQGVPDSAHQGVRAALKELNALRTQGDVDQKEIDAAYAEYTTRLEKYKNATKAEAHTAKETEEMLAPMREGLRQLDEKVASLEKMLTNAKKTPERHGPAVQSALEKEIAQKVRTRKNIAATQAHLKKEAERVDAERVKTLYEKGLKKDVVKTKEQKQTEAVAAAQEGKERRERKSGRLSMQQLENTIKELEAKQKDPKLNKAGVRLEINDALKELRGQQRALTTLQIQGKVKPKRPGSGTLPADNALKGAISEKRRLLEEHSKQIMGAKAVRGTKLNAAILDVERALKALTGAQKSLQGQDIAESQELQDAINDHQKALAKYKNIKQTEAEFKEGVESEERRDEDSTFRESEGASGVDAAEAQKVADRIVSKLPKGMAVTYAPTIGDIPIRFLKAIARAGKTPKDVKGMLLSDGSVLVVGENHTTVADVEETFAHELIGHYGVDALLGPKGVQDLVDALFARGDSHVYQLATALGVYDSVVEAEMAAVGAGANLNKQRILMVRELIAHASEGRRVKAGAVEKVKQFIKDMVNAVRNAFSRMGMKNMVALDTKTIHNLILKAHKDLESGQLGTYRSPSGGVVFRTGDTTLPGTFSAKTQTLIDKGVATEKSTFQKVKANLFGLNFETQFVDSLAPIARIASRMQDSLAATQMMTFLRFHGQRANFVAEVASKGKLELVKQRDAKTGADFYMVQSKKGDSLVDMSKALSESDVPFAAASRLFTMYMAALRAKFVGLNKLNFDPNIVTQDAIDSLMADLKRPENAKTLAAFEKARGIYNTYNAGLLDFAVQMGAISKELAVELKAKKDFIPYYRMREGVAQLVIGTETPITIGNVRDQPYLQQLVGGGEPIFDIMTSSVQNTSMWTDMALRNQATKDTAFKLQKLGLAKILPTQTGAGPDVIRFKLDGKDHHAVIKTEGTAFEDIDADLLVKGMEGIKTVYPAALRILGAPATLLRKAVTLNPLYGMRQIVRDSLSAHGVAGADFIPVVTPVKELLSSLRGTNATYKLLESQGMLGGQVLTGTIEDMSTFLRQISSGKTGWQTRLAQLESLSMKADSSVRVAAYNSYMKQGLNEMEAWLGALETMNFNKRGVSPSIYVANALIPFFNAQIQGLNVLVKSFQGKMAFNERLNVRGKLLQRGTALAATTLLYAALMEDDEAYKNATAQQKLGNFFVRIPGVSEPLRVPIPFEYGLLFKALPEAMMLLASKDEDAAPVLKALGNLAINSVPGVSSFGSPQAFKPIVEVAMGKDFFQGADIESPRLQRLSPDQRYNERTTELAKMIGGITGGVGLSPVKIDHLIRGYTTVLGVALVGLADPLMAKEGPPQAEKKASQYPLVGTLFQPTDAGGRIDRVYTLMQEFSQASNTYKTMLEEGHPKEAEAYLQAYEDKIVLGKLAPKFYKDMGQIAKAERAVKADEDMQPSEKRKELDALRQQKIEYAKDYREAIRQSL